MNSEHTAENDAGYTDPRCGCTDREGIHAVTCRFWPLCVIPPGEAAPTQPGEQP